MIIKGKSIISLLIFFNLIVFDVLSQDLEIYVSPNGNDTAIGDISNPVATLKQAAALAREKAGKIPVNIYLSGGHYRLTEPLKLGFLDGGTKNAPITWQSINGEAPIISGGISLKNWKQEENGLWSASLPENYHGKFRSFYVNNKRAIRARFPDKDFLKVTKAGEDNRTNFFFEKGHFPKVEKTQELELVFMHDWSITRIGVKSIDYKTNHLVATDSIGSRLPFFTITNWEKHPRYFLENAIEFLDSPGEWFCDFAARKIYYHPDQNEKIDEMEGVIPIANKLLTITGTKEKHVAYINFKGITFEHTNWQIPSHGYCGVQACMYNDRGENSKGWEQVPAAIELDITNNVGFYDCIVRHTGGSGIWIRQNSSFNQVTSSHIYDISGNGINIGEGQDRMVYGAPWWKSAPEQVSSNNKINNSLIEDCGKQFYGAIGIWAGLVSNTVIAHNEIRNLPYTGISIGWMWSSVPTPNRENIINANHIHHIMNKLSDGGGIYCLGLQPGTRITNNLIHDVTLNAGRAESNGMFLDEGIKDLLVENNIVYNIAKSPLRFHKASVNMVRNNVFVIGENTPPIRYNNTKEEDIKKSNNLVLSETSKVDMEKLQSLIKKRSREIGPSKKFN